jgi:prophage regulatory protein
MQRSELMNDQERFIHDAECERMTGLSKTTRWRMTRRNEFPGKVKISVGRTAYRLSDILAWMSSRPCISGRKAA